MASVCSVPTAQMKRKKMREKSREKEGERQLTEPVVDICGQYIVLVKFIWRKDQQNTETATFRWNKPSCIINIF